MRHVIAPVKNIVNLQSMYDSLSNRTTGIPGMGLAHGFAGLGKTTAIAALVGNTNALNIVASPIWSPSAMLGQLMRELGSNPIRQLSSMMDYIVRQIGASRRTLIIDDINFVIENRDGRQANQLLEILRAIHDQTNLPILLVGHQGTERLIERPQLRRRISEELEFKPLDMEDARILADTICEVTIADDLLQYLFDEMKGNAGFMTVGLAKIERLGKTKANGEDLGKKKIVVDRKVWGDRKFGLGLGRVA